MVVPMHNPLELANALASLDSLSGGRLIVGAGVGWSERRVPTRWATASTTADAGWTSRSTCCAWRGTTTP